MAVKFADNAKTVALKVTSAFMVGGKVAKAGEVVEVRESDAKDLLHRGKAVLAVEYREKAGETQPADGETKPAEGETVPAETETQAEDTEQPAAPAKAKGGKKGK